MNLSVLISKLEINELIELKKIIDNNINLKLRNSDTGIDNLNISIRARNCLSYYGIYTLNQITKYKYDDFAKLKNIGYRTVSEINDLLLLHGLDWNK